MSPGVVSSTGARYCETDADDFDSDGFAREQGRSCIIEGSLADAMPACLKVDEDSNGDGIGYERGQACRIIVECSLFHIDADGDGYGREGNTFCEVSN